MSTPTKTVNNNLNKINKSHQSKQVNLSINKQTNITNKSKHTKQSLKHNEINTINKQISTIYTKLANSQTHSNHKQPIK